jgi:hypothetical protein
MLSLAMVPMMVVGGCAPSDSDTWRGYYYANVLSNDAPLTKGAYADGPQCVAAMQTMLRHAPTTANFTCGRGCKAGNGGAVSDCTEVAR